MTLRIEQAKADQVELVAEIIRRAFARQAQALGMDRDHFPNYVAFETGESLRRRMAGGQVVLLAYRTTEIGEDPVGTISYRQDPAELARGEIQRLAVLPEHRKKGYGAQLLAEAERQMAERGVREVTLSLVASLLRLQNYYEEMGYQPLEMRQLSSLPFDVLIMGKQLRPRG